MLALDHNFLRARYIVQVVLNIRVNFICTLVELHQELI
jgi:hypothetical protein